MHIHKDTPNIHILNMFKVRVGARKSTRRATGKRAREDERLNEKAREKDMQYIVLCIKAREKHMQYIRRTYITLEGHTIH